jgi:transposase
MSRCQKDPLRPLTDEERSILTQISRAHSEPASHVARAKILLAVAAGHPYQTAARSAGRKSGEAVAHLVARFNREGVSAIEPGHAGGRTARYGVAERERILAEVQRPPDREQEGTATWSLSTLRQALRTAEDGLPHLSTFTIWSVLRDAGWSWQHSRTWCRTGTVTRKRKHGLIEVTDPDTEAKKT